MEAFLADLLSLTHWPFLAMVSILTIVGQFAAMKVFTRSRAYAKGGMQWFWWWGRESLSLHPIAAGAFAGLVFTNPEGADPAWTVAASATYFASAGVLSLFAFAVIKGYLKKRGIDASLPGYSGRPPSL
jgi:hypothetical protein